MKREPARSSVGSRLSKPSRSARIGRKYSLSGFLPPIQKFRSNRPSRLLENKSTARLNHFPMKLWFAGHNRAGNFTVTQVPPDLRGAFCNSPPSWLAKALIKWCPEPVGAE